jgi:hypothetical protein
MAWLVTLVTLRAVTHGAGGNGPQAGTARRATERDRAPEP